MASIELSDVSVNFPLLQYDQRSLKKLLSAPLQRARIAVDSRERPMIQALKNINLKFHDGDRVGLIGANGAGKSTLLRVLAGIYPPTSGEIKINGNVAALLTVGLGMRDDVSGYDNIEFGLLLMGVPSQDINIKRDEIIEFAGLNEFIHVHVGAYSAGMRTRLAFSIATAIDPEILVIDEVFGAGDAAFIRKAEMRMNELMAKSRILVFASHGTDLIEKFCDKAIWFDSGEIRQIGSVKSVGKAYLEASSQQV